MVIMVGLLIAVDVFINNLDPKAINEYPNYLFIYWTHSYGPAIFGGIVPIIYYTRNRPLREAVFRELKDLASRLCPSQVTNNWN
jgi:hypothetical protein